MKIVKNEDYEKKFLIHDIEVFENWFSNILLFPKKNKLIITMLWDKEIPPNINDEIKQRLPNYDVTFVNFPTFIKFLDKFDPILIGYNSFRFDDPLLTIAAESFKNFSKITQFLEFIHKEAQLLIKSNHRYKKRYTGIDMMRVSGLDRIFKPMKQTASNLRHHLIQDLPKAYDARIELEDIVDLVVYEVNDVEIPEKMLYGIPKEHNSPTIPKTAYEGLLPAIKFRIDIGDKWNLNLINDNKSKIGEKLVSKFYSESSGRLPKDFKKNQTKRTRIKYADVIFDNVVFKTKELQAFLIKLKKLVYFPNGDKEHKKQFKFNLDLFGLNIDFAQGGLHFKPKSKRILIPKSNQKKYEADGNSYYPMLYWKYEIEPKHLPGFSNFVKEALETRLQYKKEGKKVYANGIKIPLNRAYGNNLILN